MLKKFKSLFLLGSFVIALSAAPALADTQQGLPDFQYYGYKIVHHMTQVVKHIETFGLNSFDHPRISDYRSFVITPALDHFYSKAIADLRFGPVVVEIPSRDDRYASIQIIDQEHFTIYDKLTAKDGERFVLAHEDYRGKLPSGTVVKTKSNFPYVFLRTQAFSFNNDKLADMIRRQARIYGAHDAVELPNPKDTLALIKWSIANSNPYAQTAALMTEAATDYTPEKHKETFTSLREFIIGGGITDNRGMFEPVDHPAGGSHKIRASGTLLGHLGFPVHHAYYQQVPVDRQGKRLAGSNGPFVLTLPHDPGVNLFWSLTRYDGKTYLPLDPATTGGVDIQSYNAFNTKPDKNGNVTFTFSTSDPEDGTYWMPVPQGGYYLIVRYYGVTPRLNGNTVQAIVYGGTPLSQHFKSMKF
ncbi:MAG: DUF1254 domain-containing protein [Desulfuromonadales bacterium]|nr:DUF1254 domain-containing protein [Desulfuromonadales bacterium]